MKPLSALDWYSDRLLLNNLTFRLQHPKMDAWDGDENHFIFYKDKKLIDQYQIFFNTQPLDFAPKNIIEIGMWDGGSAVFWNEIFEPDLLVGIDLLDTGGGEYFKKYKSSSLKTYWGTNQADAQKLRQIVKENFGPNQIDLIFDDASHLYKPSLISFNTLFPYMKKGGFYIIEDWAWFHWKGHENVFPVGSQPTRLVFQLVEACANPGLIESVNVYSGFVAIKRSQQDFKGDIEHYELENHIYRHPIPLVKKLKFNLKEMLKKA